MLSHTIIVTGPTKFKLRRLIHSTDNIVIVTTN